MKQVFTFGYLSCALKVYENKPYMYLPARSLSIPGLGIIRGISIRGALVAVLVLGRPRLPGQPCRHPVDGEVGRALELHVLQGDDQEPGSGCRDGHKGSKNQDLSQI